MIRSSRWQLMGWCLPLFLFACASKDSPQRARDVGETATVAENSALAPGLPPWAIDQEHSCGKAEICAVGSGMSSNVADAKAREALAKVFSTKVISKFSYGQNLQEGEVSEEASEELEELTDEVLEGVEIKKRHESDGIFYSLSYLAKAKVVKVLKMKIEEIDRELSVFLTEGPKAYGKMLQLWKKRVPLNERHLFLTNLEMVPPVDMEKMLKEYRQHLASIHLVVEVAGGQGAANIRPLIVNHLSNLGHQIEPKDGPQVTNKIIIRLKSEDQYIKVKGFVKEKFTLEIENQDKDGVAIGVISHTLVVVGRDYQQALDKALVDFAMFLEQEIWNLNL